MNYVEIMNSLFVVSAASLAASAFCIGYAIFGRRERKAHIIIATGTLWLIAGFAFLIAWEILRNVG